MKLLRIALVCLLASPALAQPATAPSASSEASTGSTAIPQSLSQRIYEQTVPALVGVQLTWEYEYGKAEFIVPGVVVSEDGLVMMPLGEFIPRAPQEQLKDFKIIVPSWTKDDEEIDAEFVGRDPRSDVNFVRAKEKRTWKPVKFEDVPVKIGEPLLSVGILSRDAGYRPYLAHAIVAAYDRSEMPRIITTGGGLASVGAPVFNLDGKAIGWVNHYSGTQELLHTNMNRRGDDQIDPSFPLMFPPRLYVPTIGFQQSLNDPPTAGQPMKLAWMGAPNLSGMNKDVAAAYGLENQPAIEVGDVVPGAPAEQAGLKVGMKIVKVDGKPIPRADLPNELPAFLTRQIIRKKPGDKVTLTVMTAKDEPTKDLVVTLGERPSESIYAKRYWAEDLGFGARALVWQDTYERKQPADLKGALITIIKPNSAAANAKLAREDIITAMNSQAVTDIEQFEKDYKQLRADKPSEALVLVVMKRDGSTQTIRIEPPQ